VAVEGFGCSNTWLEKQQPSLKDMQLPCLLINSFPAGEFAKKSNFSRGMGTRWN
jgi:hypothetical protein